MAVPSTAGGVKNMFSINSIKFIKLSIFFPAPLHGEALQALKVALEMLNEGKRDKALRLFKQAEALSPHHPDILLHYGEFIEEEDIIHAEHLYVRALAVSPGNSRALANRGTVLAS